MGADYNGWADLPEAEREALDVLELGLPHAARTPWERTGSRASASTCARRAVDNVRNCD